MMALSYMSCMHAIIVHLILTVYVTSMQGAPSMSLSMQPSRLGANAIAQVQQGGMPACMHRDLSVATNEAFNKLGICL